MRVVLADHGAGNLRSVCAALERAGAEPAVSRDPAQLSEAPLVLIAGVGNAASAARALEAGGLAAALRERAGRGRPIFGICLGLQLLFEESDEGGVGLGFLPGRARRLQARRVPHMGWNTLVRCGPSALLEGLEQADMYFAHSYACEPAGPIVVAEVDHEGPVVAAVERDALAGVQFHPERSGATGARLLDNVLSWSRSA